MQRAVVIPRPSFLSSIGIVPSAQGAPRGPRAPWHLRSLRSVKTWISRKDAAGVIFQRGLDVFEASLFFDRVARLASSFGSSAKLTTSKLRTRSPDHWTSSNLRSLRFVSPWIPARCCRG